MKEKKRSTILEETSKNPQLLASIVEGLKDSHQRYLSAVILGSSELATRRDAHWEFKSLMHFGEEDFARGGSFRVMYGIETDDLRDWHRQAARALASEVTRSFLYEEDEGLVLFVRDVSGYRPACKGDSPYDFVKRLYADGNLSDIAIDNPPSWALELFVNKQNLDAYSAIWYDAGYLSDPEYVERKRIKREAVWRETLKRLGRQPFLNSIIPEPCKWSSLSTSDGAQSASVEPSGEVGRANSPEDLPLAGRERNTLLAIIAALCKESKIDFTKAAKAAGLIQGIAATIGVHLGETTIENHLKKIPAAIENRTKFGLP
jgi:hypothetical protein